jgi:hypothetical protein
VHGASATLTPLQDVDAGFFPAIESNSCPHAEQRIRLRPVRSISAGGIRYAHSVHGVLRSKARGSIGRARHDNSANYPRGVWMRKPLALFFTYARRGTDFFYRLLKANRVLVELDTIDERRSLSLTSIAIIAEAQRVHAR